MKKINVISLALSIMMMVFFAGCGTSKDNTTTITKETTTVVFHNTTTHVFHNTTTHVPVVTAPAAITINSLYADQTVEPGRANVAIGNAVLSADKTSGVTIQKYVVDFKLLSGNWMNLNNIKMHAGVIQVGATKEFVSFGSENHTPVEFSVNTDVPAGQSLPIQVYADITQAEVGTSFSVSIRAIGTTAGGQPFSTSDIDCQIMTIGKADVTLTDSVSQGGNAVLANTEIISGEYAFEAIPNEAITSMTFTVNGPSAVAAVKVMTAPTPESSPTILGMAPVVADSDYSGKAIVDLAPNAKINSTLKLASSVVLNNEPGANVYVALTSFSVVNSQTGATATYTANASGMWVRTFKALPSMYSVSLPSKVLNNGVSKASRFQIWSNGEAVSWKQMATFEIKSSSGLDIVDYRLVNDSTNQIIPAAKKVTCTTEFDGSKTTLVTFVANDEQVIPAGTGTNYSLEIQVDGPILMSSYVSTSFKSQNTRNWINGNRFSDYADSYGLIWSDLSFTDHSVGSWDWFEKTDLSSLPVQVLSR
jgi:hypothetical protein